MKMIKNTVVALVIGCGVFSSAFAQYQPADKIPNDPQVRTGHLSNGLTYYLLENEKPENKLELRLVLNVGSMQETEAQSGLAHFMEHMVFNGTEHFPKHELVDYLESIGVKFGADLNAYTSFDETVYMLPITIEKGEEVIHNGFQVLQDWAQHASLEEDEIDAERGVILEEWRSRKGLRQRIQEQTMPYMYHGSKYPERLPIGRTENLKTFPYEELSQFYKTWYRPDLMAVIVVGDMKVDKMEGLVKEYFSSLKNPKNAPERKQEYLKEHKEPLYVVATDEEMPGYAVHFMIKDRAVSAKSVGDFRSDIERNMFVSLLNQRLGEVAKGAKAPFLSGSFTISGMTRGMEYFGGNLSVKKEQIQSGFEALLTEYERARKFGFYDSEIERLKKNYMTSMEKALHEAGKKESSSYVGAYQNHFLNGEAYPSTEYRYWLYKELLPKITAEDIRLAGSCLMKDENMVLMVIAPEKDREDLPTEEEMLGMFSKAQEKSLTKWEEENIDDTLIDELPSSGKIIEEKYYEKAGVTEWDLSNGAKILVKPTDFKEDEIIMSASSDGGTSLYRDEEYLTASFASATVGIMGVGKHSPDDLRKALTGKSASVSSGISTYGESLQGNSTVRDLETMFELTYLHFTSPRKDEALWENAMSNQKTRLENSMDLPDFKFDKARSKYLYDNHPRSRGFDQPDDYDQVDLDRALEIYRERFANAGDFTFAFVGNIDLEAMKPLVEKYIGSLPGVKEDEDFKDIGWGYREGPGRREFEFGMEERAQVVLILHGDADYSHEDALAFSMMGDALQIKLLENLREELGGVYGVGARASLSKIPNEQFSLSVSFTCALENVDLLVNAAKKEISVMLAEGPTEIDLGKVKEARLKSYRENLKRNGYWLRQLINMEENHQPYESILEKEQKVLEVSTDEIQQLSEKLLDLDEMIQLIRKPEK